MRCGTRVEGKVSDRVQHRARGDGGFRLSGEGKTPGLGKVHHGAVGRLGDGGVEQADRVTRIGDEGLASGIEEIAGGGIGPGQVV